MSIPRPKLRTLPHLSTLLLSLCICGLLTPAFAQQPSGPAVEPDAAAQKTSVPQSAVPQSAVPPATANFTSFITDQDGDSIPGATITLSRPDRSTTAEPTDEPHAISGNDGSFSFTNIEAGSFHLTISAPGFTTRQATLSLQPGQQAEIPAISLTAAANINVEVTASQQEIAQAQIELAEKQRILGVIPNFYVSYDSNPVPLVAKQKFQIAWKMSVDPVNFLMTGVIAGAEQSQNTFAAYGQGAQGYAKRFGATYADGFISTMIANALLPAVLRQDPRYFYKGTGSVTSRSLYAIANAVICKGDNGHWQPNYSNILGDFATAGISNLYYPPANRQGVELTVQNTLIGLVAASGSNLVQEFLIRRITPRTHRPLTPLP